MATCKVPESYLTKLCERYRKARKKDRGKILDELVATTGYHRKHAVALLRGKRRHRNPKTPIRRLRRRIYLAEDKRAVLWLAELFDQISSQRLRAAMNAELEHVRADLEVSRACFRRLQRISPSTMDRFRRTERRPLGRHRGGTKPGTLLKSQIKVRTFADWDDKRPGFEEIDLVQHDGGNPSGFFACTLDVTDVSTGWTEMQAVATKAQQHVFAALEDIRGHLPFPLLGLDSDNGAEFINDELVRYCTDEQLTFTRSRAGRKND
ncbi:MAG TPA: integrase, partial [Verrucomicrobiae bacterium]